MYYLGAEKAWSFLPMLLKAARTSSKLLQYFAIEDFSK
jgi:hypothetical protein